MNFSVLQHNLYHLLRQRNSTICLLVLMVVANIILGTSLLLKSEKVVIVPPNIRQTFWVRTHDVSREYLEEMSLFLIHQMLDVSAVSAEYQNNLILRHVAPEYYGVLKKKLQDELAFYRKKQVALSFKAVEIDINQKHFSVIIKGDLTSYVAGKKLSSSRDTYKLQYRYKNGELLLTEFTLLEEEQA